MLPMLRELDAGRAEVLLRDNAAARANLQRFPKGIASPESISIHSGDSPSGEMQMNQQVQVQLRQRSDQVVEEAEKNPQQALSDALALPLSAGDPRPFFPPLNALQGIARDQAHKKPKARETALVEMGK